MCYFIYVDKLENEWCFEQLGIMSDTATYVIKGTPLRFSVSRLVMATVIDLDKMMMAEAEICIKRYVQDLR